MENYKNPFENLSSISGSDEDKKRKKQKQNREDNKIDLSELDEPSLEKINKLEKVVELLFADKQELRAVYEKIRNYLPENKKNLPPETIWEDLSHDGGKVLCDEEIINNVFQEVNNSVKKEVEEKEGADQAFSGLLKDEYYKVEMKNFYANFLNFKSLLEDIKKRDNYYEIINEYRKAKNEKEKEAIWSNIPEELKDVLQYKNFVLREFVEARKESEELKNKIEANKRLIYQYQSEGASEDKINLAAEELKEAILDYENLISSSPELYYYECSKRLEEAKDVIDNNGSIIETPYVKAKMVLIESFGNRPVFIHGELGSGKTELAKYVSAKKYSENYLKDIWEKNNPQPKEEGKIAKWEKERQFAGQALLISGHKNIDIGEFFGSKEMKTKESLAPENLADLIEKTVQRVKDERKSNGESLSLDEEKDIRDIAKENSKNPLEVKTIIGNFYQAMKDGRPIILDEINAIPHTALIAINDLLTLKPGDAVNPLMPGIEKFKVKDGFKVFATGNWKPEDGKAYFGRQGLDAAFLSRFAIVSYDYLPQRVIGNSETSDAQVSQEEHAENELFFIMASSLLDKKLGLNLPQGSLEKLSALASGSRVLQNIFSEKEEGDVEFEWLSANKKLKQKDVLKENVLSIRHLIPIIKNWKKDGYKNQLEEYILKDYIDRSQNSRNSEKLLIYRLLQNIHGGILFQEEDGWPSSSGVNGEKEVLKLSADSRLFKHSNVTGEILPDLLIDKNIKTEYLSTKKVIEVLFGKFPERQFVDKRIFEKKSSNLEDKEGFKNLDLSELRNCEDKSMKLKKALNNLKKTDLELDDKDKELIEKIDRLIS